MVGLHICGISNKTTETTKQLFKKFNDELAVELGIQVAVSNIKLVLLLSFS